MRGYPTFVAVNAGGEVIDRWVGYGGVDAFVSKVDESIADPTTVPEKIERFETEPSAELAAVLGRIHGAGTDHTEAVRYFEEAGRLAPERADEFVFDVFLSKYSGLRSESFTFDEVVESGRQVLATETVDAGDRLLVARIVTGYAVKEDRMELLAEFIEPGLAATEGADDEDMTRGRNELLILQSLHIDGDGERAVELKRASLSEGWEEDAGELNSFAWWCFENELNIEEAESLARRGAELAEDGSERAMILDTVAELCFLRGDCDEAVSQIAAAIEADPDRDYYQEQKTRFEEECAG